MDANKKKILIFVIALAVIGLIIYYAVMSSKKKDAGKSDTGGKTTDESENLCSVINKKAAPIEDNLNATCGSHARWILAKSLNGTEKDKETASGKDTMAKARKYVMDSHPVKCAGFTTCKDTPPICEDIDSFHAPSEGKATFTCGEHAQWYFDKATKGTDAEKTQYGAYNDLDKARAYTATLFPKKCAGYTSCVGEKK